MKDLHDKGLILTRRENGECNEYKLSDKGEYLARILNELAA
jgi:predicted transcriptional regulator